MYEKFYNFKLEQMVQERENILWLGKPDKRCFVLESIFNPFLPFALIWFLFDAFFIFLMFSSPEVNVNGTPTPVNETLKFAIPFFALHLMPVWIYLGGVLFTFQKHKNTEYIITDKAVYISGGIFSYNCERRELEYLKNITTRQGFFDKRLMVGDVIIGKYITGTGKSSHEVEIAICDIPDFQNVYSMINELRENIRRRKQ